ncbi:MAG: DUF4861 family protein [Bacteroidota bacterium]|nr:DUF4861 family protein [Bacteroidota bacterium]
MKKYLFLLIVANQTTLVMSQPITIEAKNPIAIQREQETISIPLLSIQSFAQDMKGKNFVVFNGKKGMVSQLVDENLDGTQDVIVFQSSFAPLETKRFTISISETERTYTKIVDGRFIPPREDFAWENDRVAFRMYGPALTAEVNNGIDVWTKRVRYPIVEKWYSGEQATPKINYHKDHGEGADFFTVGTSLGVGGSGLMVSGKLFQPGVFSYYKVITNGPIRVSFELYYPTWNILNKKIFQSKRITLDAGSQLNKIVDRFMTNVPFDSCSLAVGLVKRGNTTFQQGNQNRSMALWGLTNADSINEYLGTAVLFSSAESSTAGDDSLQYLTTFPLQWNSQFTYYSGFAWTRMGDITSEQQWKEYVNIFQQRTDNPLQLTIHRKK